MIDFVIGHWHWYLWLGSLGWIWNVEITNAADVVDLDTWGRFVVSSEVGEP